MKEKELDGLDKRLIQLLAKDGRMSVGILAERLGVTPPTVRHRIESLTSSGVLRISGLINSSSAKDISTAVVGICLERHQELDEKIEQISNLKQVHWVAAVTGRYDIIVEVVLTEGILDVYRFLTEGLPRVGGIHSSESFMVMKAKGKWVLLPEGDEQGLP